MVTLTILGAGCQSRQGLEIRADLTVLEKLDTEGKAETLGIFGGSGKKVVKPVETEKANFLVDEEGLKIDFEENGRFQCTPAAIGLPESWFRMRKLDLILSAEGEGRLLFEVYGSRTRLIDTLLLNPGRSAYSVDITEVPLLGGIESRPLYIRLSTVEPQTVLVTAISMAKENTHPFLVDRWGQRARKSWPGKVASLAELRDERSDAEVMTQFQPSIPLDAYGGYADHDLSLNKTGFFHTQFSDDRWWLVTPEGNPFYSLGVNGVRIKSIRGNADVSRVQGREWMFEEIPAVEECPECFREDGAYFSYYCWNVKRKYDSIDAWRTHTYDRLRSIGFNTIGNWSDTIFYRVPQMPYTYTLDTRREEAFVMANGMPDVFHPEWKEHLERTFADIVRFRKDPYLLGYFVDNEMGWRSVTRLDTASFTGRKLQTALSGEEQLSLYAEQYFSSIENVLSQFDPNHLYLGCRFTRNFDQMAPVARAAARSVDVVSINVYSAYPVREQMDRWYDAVQKPMLIGEHHIPPVTPKQLLPHWPAFEIPERNEMVQNYVYTWLEFPYAVGSHWYQFKDQEVAGRGDGGENQPVGLLTVTDKLNRELVWTYYQIGREIPKRLLAGELK